MSYYCEMCGRDIESKNAKRAVVEGSLLILCPECYSRLSKQTIVRDIESTRPPTSKPAAKQRIITRPAKLIEDLEVVEDYASRIRSARESLGWSQEVLAQKTGETVSTIKRIESGRLKPSIELARKLERVLGVKLLEPVVQEGASSKPSDSISYLTIGDIINVNIENKSKKKGA
ncbi:MAG: multiprotein bridging factor aMBF1 [Desulfurococcaceae archaeon]